MEKQSQFYWSILPYLASLRETKFCEMEEKVTGIYSGILTAGINDDYSFHPTYNKSKTNVAAS